MRRILLFSALLAACGSDGGGGGEKAPLLDCSVMQAQDSCWKKMLESVEGCVPSATTYGTYSADRTSCHYDVGAEVSFTGPVPDDPFAPGSEFDWSFRMKVADSSCVDWKEGLVNGRSIFQITTRAGLVRFEADPDEASLTCDDGTRYVTDNPASTLACAPTRVLSSDAGAASISLGIAGETKSVHVFTCDAPF